MSDRKADLIVSGKPLSSLRVVDLKQELEKRGISKSGTKKDLMDRLRTRLELEMMQQTAPSAGEVTGGQVPNLSLQDEQQNDFVKAYLAEQQQSYQKQIEIRQQVISEASDTPVIAEMSGGVAAIASAAPIPQPEPQPEPQTEEKSLLKSPVQTEDLTPTKQVRSTRSSRTAEPPSQIQAETILQSAPVSEVIAAPQTVATDHMPAAEVTAAGASSVPDAPSVEKNVSSNDGQSSDQVNEKDSAPLDARSEKSVTIAADAVTDHDSAGPLSEPNCTSGDQKPQTTESPCPEKMVCTAPSTEAKKESETEKTLSKEAPSTAIKDVEVSEKVVVETSLDKDLPDSKLPAVAAAPVPPKSPAKESEKKREQEKLRSPEKSPKKSGDKGEDRHRSEHRKSEDGSGTRERTSERRRLVSEKKPEEGGEEAKSRPKRKWGSGSDRQISRGISSTQLNDLLPKKEKVSAGGQEEGQGEVLAAESITVSGQFSQPANGSLAATRVTAEIQASDVEEKEPTDRQRPVNGQATSEEESKEIGAARNPPSRLLFVENLTRPFTLQALHSLLKTYGTIDVDKFWTDKIKSMCIVTYSSIEEAEAARKALYGYRWPGCNPKTLVADFSTEEEIELRKREAEKPAVVSQPPPTRTATDKYDVTIRKSLPEDEENAEKPIRDWDREKVSHSSPPPLQPSKRSRRSPSPPVAPSQKQAPRLIEEPECPAKLLDDLFKKTHSSPIVYWLPLNEEEAQNRAQLRKEREKRRVEERDAREAQKQSRRSPPPSRPVRSPRPVMRSPRTGYRSGVGGDRSRVDRSPRSLSRSRSPVRRDGGRYRSPARRSPPRRSPPRRR